MIRGIDGSICRNNCDSRRTCCIVWTAEIGERSCIVIDMCDEHSCAWHLGIPSLVCNAFKNIVFIACGIVVVHYAQSLTAVCKWCEGYVSRILEGVHLFCPSHKFTFPCCVWGRVETVECVLATIHKIPFLHALVVVFRDVSPVYCRVEIWKSHGMAHFMEEYTYA